jgi:hypothetical protein
MKDHIFLLNKDGKLIELNEKTFNSENQFQELLEKYSNLISGSQISPEDPRRWILISREVGIPSEENGGNLWSIDHLFIDQDGIPTLVEVKRSTDSRLRRNVVGQMLDYAANSVSYWTISELRAKFEQNCEANDLDPEIEISTLIGEEGNSGNFWETVETNLQAGKIRLLFVADKIPKELQRIIEFLNEQMSPAEVLGMEIKQFANKDIRTLVPRVIGKTSNAEIKKGKYKQYKWTEETFYEELKKQNGLKAEKTVRNIMRHIEPKVNRIWYGQGKTIGSIVPILDIGPLSNQLFAIYTNGKIEIYFQHLKTKPPFDDESKRKALRDKLVSIKGVDLPPDKIDKRPGIDLSLLERVEDQNTFIETFYWVVEELKRSQK